MLAPEFLMGRRQPPEGRGTVANAMPGDESIELAVPHPPRSYPASVRPNVQQGLFHPKTRALGQTDARAATGAVIHQEGTLGVGRSDGTDARRARGETEAQSDGEAVARPLFPPLPSIIVRNVRTVRTSYRDPDLMRRHPAR
jgi:hypothetical protein